jgi:polysaccharide chain length determinant protein (PEP-CTERM system associated)
MIPGKQYTPELLLQLAWRHKWRIAIPLMVVAITACAIIYKLPNRYQSDTLILVVPQRVPETYVRATVTTSIADRLQAISQQILSRTRLERIIQDFNLYADRRRVDIMEDIVERMRKDIDVQIVKGDAFRVSFTSEDPRTAMRVAERLASFFIDESLRDREVLAEGTNQFLESQLEDARRRLIENEKLLEEYRRKHDGQLPSQLEANMQGLHNTEMQLQALRDSLNRDRDRRLMLDRQINDATSAEAAMPAAASVPPPPRSTSDDGDAKGSATEQLRVAQANLQTMLLRLRPEHPDVIRMKRSISELQRRADAEAAERPTPVNPPLTAAEKLRLSRLQEAREEIANLDQQIANKTLEEKRLHSVVAEYQSRIEAAPTRESELSELTRDYSTLQHTYQSLLAKKQESQLAANLERRQIGEQFKILDAARLPEKPASPDRPRLYILAVVAAMMIGFGFAAVSEYFDRSLRSEEDVRLAINLLVLATIPNIERTRASNRRLAAASVTGVVVAVVGAAAAAAWTLLR